jgi:tRNA-(ms[2]io[6]A)-hydroxylase
MLGLLVATDDAWAPVAAADLGALLADHAHCEMKAASNAMSLVARYGGMHDVVTTELIMRLTDLAHEEIDHFRRVMLEIARRGERLGVPPVDDYAALLRARAAALPWVTGRPRDRAVSLVERLIVCALIEARSAERFKLLTAALEASGEMHAFYAELFASEARHYRVFLELATQVCGDEAMVRARFAALAEIEAGVVTELSARGPRAAIHG